MSMLKLQDFDYSLPEELIAQRPLAQRSASRMLVVDRRNGTWEHAMVEDLTSWLEPGDLAVFNNTKVVPARFFSDDGRIEVVKLEEVAKNLWKCLVRPGRKMRVGDEVVIGGVRGKVSEVCAAGERLIAFDQFIDPMQWGRFALPPYIHRQSDAEDGERYQTIFAHRPGAIAAPTAGLHFTSELLQNIPHTFVTLHVGVGTFQPVRTENVLEHEMHYERYFLAADVAAEINAAARILAVGTTSVRVLETCASDRGEVRSGQGETDLFITPPYDFQVVDHLFTNFHLPKSTLLMLVSAFAGRDLILAAYREAVEQKYRFFSYGDAMLIL